MIFILLLIAENPIMSVYFTLIAAFNILGAITVDLDHYNIQQSMSRHGNPYDNAVAENLFNCLKCEFTYFQHFRTHKHSPLFFVMLKLIIMLFVHTVVLVGNLPMILKKIYVFFLLHKQLSICMICSFF